MKTFFLFAFYLHQGVRVFHSENRLFELKRVHRAGISEMRCQDVCHRSEKPRCTAVRMEGNVCILQTSRKNVEISFPIACPKPRGECDPGFNNSFYDKVQTSAPVSCYLLLTSQMTWLESKEKCNRFNGELVTISTEEENDHLKKVLKRKDFFVDQEQVWIGANERDAEGDWRWVASGERMNFADWHPGEPNNYEFRDEDCASMWRNFDWLWNDSTCDVKSGAICEKPGRLN